MKIGIIGAGHIGSNLARLLVAAHHEVAIANSRGPGTLQDLVTELGEGAVALSVEEVAGFGDVVIVSIPFGKYKDLPAEAFDGKIVIDTNNYYPERDGGFDELDHGRSTSSQLLANHLKGARVVKGFNTIWFEHLRTQGNKELDWADRRAIFIAGDDAAAKRLVSGIVEDIGFAAVDTGDLADGGLAQQPGSAIYNANLTASEAESRINSGTI